MAAAILGNKSAYEMSLVPFNEQWASISNGTMDISTTQTTANMQRDIREVSIDVRAGVTTVVTMENLTFTDVYKFSFP